VVDDDAGIREALADLLADEGYHVLAAANGREALDHLYAAGAPRPCVILLDLMMPVMNGSQFYAEMRADPALSSIPVVILSADAGIAEKSKPYGGRFITKPMGIDDVLAALDSHCVD
jgi:CheY-like chemotaxis protein